jgi:hypothetical protein
MADQTHFTAEEEDALWDRLGDKLGNIQLTTEQAEKFASGFDSMGSAFEELSDELYQVAAAAQKDTT